MDLFLDGEKRGIIIIYLFICNQQSPPSADVYGTIIIQNLHAVTMQFYTVRLNHVFV